MGLLNLIRLSSLSHCTSWIPCFNPHPARRYIHLFQYLLCDSFCVGARLLSLWHMTVVGESAAFQFFPLPDYDRNVLVRGVVCETSGSASSAGNGLAQMLEKPSFTWTLQNVCPNRTRTYVSVPGLGLLWTIIPWKCIILTKQSITLFLTISVHP